MHKNKKADQHTNHDSNDQVISNVLRWLRLIDSLPDPGFNRFTRMVCQIIDVRMAMVSFVDESTNRQFFKASLGLPEGVNQTTLDRSFCKIVARTGEMLAVIDARTDARVSDNSIIEEMGVIAYLGAPILAPSGQAIGSLCAVDSVPRDWSDKQKRIIIDLAACVTDHIALRFMH